MAEPISLYPVFVRQQKFPPLSGGGGEVVALEPADTIDVTIDTSDAIVVRLDDEGAVIVEADIIVAPQDQDTGVTDDD